MSRIDKHPTTWDLEPQTQAKHEILQRYVDAWYPIMASRSKRVIFMDGFAGPGIYSNGEPGSPTLVIKRLLEHSKFQEMDCEFRFLFCEPEPNRFGSLQGQLEALRSAIGGWPSNVHVSVEQDLFTTAAMKVLESLGDRDLAPTLAFLDPFGVKGIPLAQVCELLRFPKCELLVNLAAQSIRRFRDQPEFPQHLDALFGCEDWREIDTGTVDGDTEAFANLFERQLRQRCDFKHVLSFKMLNTRNQTSYYLVFGTRHPKGLEVMKNAMWSVDPTGAFEFSARETQSGQMVLFGEGPDPRTLAEAMRQKFAGQRVLLNHIEDFVATTPFRISGHMRPALRVLEEDKHINVEGRKRVRTYPDGCVVTFE